MYVGIILVTAIPIGTALRAAATDVFGRRPLPVEVLEIGDPPDPMVWQQALAARIATLDRGRGILVFTDAYGSSPARVAYQHYQDRRVSLVAGVNLPMLLAVLGAEVVTPGLSAADLAAIAISSGREAIFGEPPSLGVPASGFGVPCCGKP